MFRWILLVDLVIDYFIEIAGGFRWAILMSKLLTWKCKPHFSTRSFLLTFASIGGEGRTKFFPSGGEMWGLVGPVLIPKIESTDLFNFTLEITNNFWRAPNYHFLEGRWYGEWTPAWGFAILPFLLLMVLNLDRYSKWYPLNFFKIPKWRYRVEIDLITETLSQRR